jgi:transposase
VEFLPEGGQHGCRTGDQMTKRTRRGRSPAFKAKVALAAVKGEKTLCRVGAAVRRSPEPDYDLRGQLPKGAAAVFGSESHSERAEAAIDVKTLHAKIGELTLVSDFCLGRSSRRTVAECKTMIERSYVLPVAR